MTENGATVLSLPRERPSTWYCTPTTPTLSEVDADTMTLEPKTVEPAVGVMIETVGGVVSGLLTVTLTLPAVVRFPAASRATAVSVCDPLVVNVVFQITEYGLDVTSAPRLEPSSL